jgi:Flp pilus assembly protein TadG
MRFLSRSSKGQSVVLFTLAIVALLGAVAFGTDVAVMYVNWQGMQKAVDAAALAAEHQLPPAPDLARSIARDYALKNGVQPSELTISLTPDNSTITVSAQRNVAYNFGRVLGLSSQLVKVSATVSNSPTGCVNCLKPQCDTCFSPTVGGSGVIPVGLQYNTIYAYDQPVLLTQGGNGNNGTWGPGNWGSLTLGAPGGSVLQSNFANGYLGALKVDDWVNSATGVKNGPVDSGIGQRLTAGQQPPFAGGTFSNHVATDPRVVVLPMVDWNHPNGMSGVEIKGFALVWIDSVNGGQINAHFIRGVVANSMPGNGQDYGARGAPILIK